MDFDYDLIHGQAIRSVHGRGRQVTNENSVHYEDIRIAVDAHTLVLGVNLDTDEIIVSLTQDARSEPDWGDVPELQDLVGRRLGWCWEARNNQGYRDCFMLAFEDNAVVPKVCFTGLASSIEIGKISSLKCQVGG